MDSVTSLFLPPGASSISGEYDALFEFILWASAVFFAIVVVSTLYFVIRYRRRDEVAATDSRDHNMPLEIAWTVVPTILIMFIFVWGFKGFLKRSIVPANAMEIKTTAQQWFWTFDYPEGVNSVNELIVPVNKPVKLLMSSRDVIHSFFVPSFRVKMDVLPNRYTVAWFEATRVGEFDLFCAEYCGKSHSEMVGKVTVLPQDEFDKWLAAGAGPAEGESLRDYGARLFVKRACVTCHSLDGTTNTGPGLKGLFGRSERMESGESITVDENYLRESMLNPMAKIAAGFKPVMPTYQGILKDVEVDALVEFIKSLED